MISRYVHRSKFVRRELAKIDRAIKMAEGFMSTSLVHKVHKLINYSCG